MSQSPISSQPARYRRLAVELFAVVLTTMPLAAHAALVSDYRFDDSSQTASNGGTQIIDSGPALKHGELRWNNAYYNVSSATPGAPTFPASGAGLPGDFLGGNHGSALDMPNSNLANSGHVAVGAIPNHDFGTSDFSVAGWFSKSTAGSTGFSAGNSIIYDNAVQDFGGYILYIDTAGKLAFEIKGGPTPSVGDNIGITSDAALNDGDWHSFVALVDNLTAYLYIDGVLQTQTAVYGTKTKATPTSGKGVRIAVEFGGQIDTLQIYSHALTSEEIAAFSPVPEPASLALLGIGAALMLRRRD